ncbi:MAG: hypothetical protein LBQ69_05420 [Treponema sp.]|jgi:uncharacterized membrane protein|nr:hypothetical protein [Treponema sp.]
MPSGKASKRLRREFMANPQQQNEKSVILTRQEINETFQGPLPDPVILERYKNADPSFPERIMRMAEAHNAADVNTKNRISLSNFFVPIIGQIFTLLLGGGGILACIYLATSGYTGGAIAAIAASFSPIIINAFKGLRQNRK